MLRRVSTEKHLEGAAGTRPRAGYDFVPTRSDYVALLRNVPMMRAATVLGWIMLVVFGLLALMPFFFVDDAGDPAGDPAALTALAVVGLPMVAFVFGYARLGALAAWRKPANRELVRATVDGEGIGHSGPSGTQSHAWSVVSGARETPEAYYLYVSNGLASLIYWLPKRAVPLDEQTHVRRQIQAHVPRYRIR